MTDKPLRIKSESGRWFAPFRAQIVAGTDGLLAITKETRNHGWVVTHVPTGQAFLLDVDSIEDEEAAMAAALDLFASYPRKQMQASRRDLVIAGIKYQQVLKWAGLE